MHGFFNLLIKHLLDRCQVRHITDKIYIPIPRYVYQVYKLPLAKFFFLDCEQARKIFFLFCSYFKYKEMVILVTRRTIASFEFKV
jgi:hypothetical protein